MTPPESSAAIADNHPGELISSRTTRMILGVLLVCPAVLFVTGPRPTIAALYFGAIAALLLMCHPSACFFLFLSSTAVYYQIAVGSLMMLPADFAALLLMLAVILDYLLRVRTEVWRSEFDLPFLAMIGAACLSVLFAHDRSLTITPTLRILVIFIAFRIVYKMAVAIGVRRILLFYFYLVSMLSAINVVVFLVYGGQERVFGPAWLPMETFAMTALPMAAAFFLGSSTFSERLRYGLMCILIAMAIFATQSRAPMVTVIIALPVMILAWRRYRRRRSVGVPSGNIFKLVAPVALVALAVYLGRETIFEAAFERIEALIHSAVSPEGTIALRLVLWTAAIKAYLSSPITGIGIGNFRIVEQIIPEVRLAPVWYYIGGLSPHNVVLHWLAETGLPGAAALLWLATRGLGAGRQVLKAGAASRDRQSAGALFIGMFIFALSIFYMRAWTWGQDGYIMALLFGLVAAWRRNSPDTEAA